MNEILRRLQALMPHGRSQRGASGVEYALLIAGIAALIVFAIYALGTMVNTTLYESSCDEINASLGSGC